MIHRSLSKYVRALKNDLELQAACCTTVSPAFLVTRVASVCLASRMALTTNSPQESETRRPSPLFVGGGGIMECSTTTKGFEYIRFDTAGRVYAFDSLYGELKVVQDCTGYFGVWMLPGWHLEPVFWRLRYRPPDPGTLLIRDGPPTSPMAPLIGWRPPTFASVSSSANVPMDYAEAVTSAPFRPGPQGQSIPDLAAMKPDVPQPVRALLGAFKANGLRAYIMERFYDHIEKEGNENTSYDQRRRHVRRQLMFDTHEDKLIPIMVSIDPVGPVMKDLRAAIEFELHAIDNTLDGWCMTRSNLRTKVPVTLQAVSDKHLTLPT